MEPLESTVHEFELVDQSDNSVSTVKITGVRTHLLPQFAEAYSAVEEADVAKHLIASAIGKEKAETIWDSGDQAEFDRQCDTRYNHLSYTIDHYGIVIEITMENRTLRNAASMILAAVEEAKTVRFD